MIIVVMGVAGSGKSTVGSLLAERLGVPFVEGDDLHDPAAIARMAAGHPLTEAERGPWLDRLNARLRSLRDDGAVCACSALTAAARRRLCDGVGPVRLVWLHGPAELLSGRLAGRVAAHQGNPVGPSLLPSQLATLEPPADALSLDVTPPPDVLVGRIVDWLGAGAGRATGDGT